MVPACGGYRKGKGTFIIHLEIRVKGKRRKNINRSQEYWRRKREKRGIGRLNSPQLSMHKFSDRGKKKIIYRPFTLWKKRGEGGGEEGMSSMWMQDNGEERRGYETNPCKSGIYGKAGIYDTCIVGGGGYDRGLDRI